ncbi:MAG: hypothetical protein WC635_06750 [Bacteriovorax sp.]|jgi:hypothetical protein
MKEYFTSVFDNELTWMVPLAILVHPLSIDIFLGPNLVNGALAFWFFIESLLQLNKKKVFYAVILIVFSSFCNLAYCFVAFYIFWKNRVELKRLKFPAAIYLIFSLMYFYKYLLVLPHNPFVFFIYYLQTILLPIYLNLFSYSLYPFTLVSFLTAAAIVIIFLVRQQNDRRSRKYWPLLFLPSLGVLISPWNTHPQFWHEIIYTPSSYIVITFAFVTILAIHIPRTIFISYILLLILISINWGKSWIPLSGLLEMSIAELPPKYEQTATAKRLLAWQYLSEDKKEMGVDLLKKLLSSDPENENLKKDLSLFSNTAQNKK